MEQDPTADGEEEGVDLEHVKEMAGFVLRAPRRRPILTAAVFTVVAALGITAASTMPRTYNSQVKLLAQANLVFPALSNPDRRVPRDADSPTKDLADQIIRRDNVVALAKETNLVERYYAARSPALKLKDKVLGAPTTADDKLLVVVATLERNVSVTILDNNVTIQVDWFEPRMAYDLVTTLQKNFQAARYDNDVAMISEAMSFLQQHAKVEADAVDAALEEYRKLVLLPAPGATANTVARIRVPRPAAARDSPTAAVAATDPDLAAELEEKRQEVRALETERQHDRETLRGQLAQAQLTLTPQHPTVIALQQKLEAMEAPDEQLARLKADERALMARIAPPLPLAPSIKNTPPDGETKLFEHPASEPAIPASTLGTPKEDPQVQLLRAKLEGAIRRYQDAVSHIDAANMELEIARTAFKYRYSVVTPAEVPRKPKNPVAQLVGVGSVIAALLLALLLAAGADLWSGRILEEWQVRRGLKLVILGEFDPKTPMTSGRA